MRTPLRDLMSQPGAVARLTASFEEIAELLHQQRISTVPVIDRESWGRRRLRGGPPAQGGVGTSRRARQNNGP
jgi:CBS-domain-containing membrane protein